MAALPSEGGLAGWGRNILADIYFEDAHCIYLGIVAGACLLICGLRFLPPPVRHPLYSHLVESIKVEPCFRVGSNRDGVLLGLVHALGGRLSCSSAHDINAGVGAARRASPIPAPPPRLLDRHVCRSPALLRASVAAGVQLYEVWKTGSSLLLNEAAIIRMTCRRISAVCCMHVCVCAA